MGWGGTEVGGGVTERKSTGGDTVTVGLRERRGRRVEGSPSTETSRQRARSALLPTRMMGTWSA